MTDERKGKPSCSDLGNLAACPGKYRACHGLPPLPSNDWTEAGNRIHKALETGDKSVLQPDDLQQYEWLEQQTKQLIEEFGEPDEVIREQRMWMPSNSFSGQADVLVFNRSKALIIDYKTGFAEVTSADRNWQMRGLAVLAFHNHNVGDIKVVVLEAFLKRRTEAVYDHKAIWDAELLIGEVLAKAYRVDAPRIPGEQCTYCRAKLTCDALAAQQTAIAKVDNPELLSPDQMSAALDIIPQVKKRCDAIIEHAKGYLEAGGAIPGWTLEDGPERREIADVENAYIRSTLQPHEFLGTVSVAVGKLEEAWVDKFHKLFGGTKEDGRREFNKMFSDLIERKPTAKRLKKEK